MATAISSSLIANSKIIQNQAKFTFPVVFPFQFPIQNQTNNIANSSNLVANSVLTGQIKIVTPIASNFLSTSSIQTTFTNTLKIINSTIGWVGTIVPPIIKSNLGLISPLTSNTSLTSMFTNSSKPISLLTSNSYMSSSALNGFKITGTVATTTAITGVTNFSGVINGNIISTSTINGTIAIKVFYIPQIINATSTINDVQTAMFKAITNIVANTSIAGTSKIQSLITSNFIGNTNISGNLINLISSSSNSISNIGNYFTFPLVFPFIFGDTIQLKEAISSNVTATSTIVNTGISSMLNSNLSSSSVIAGNISCQYSSLSSLSSLSTMISSESVSYGLTALEGTTNLETNPSNFTGYSWGWTTTALVQFEGKECLQINVNCPGGQTAWTGAYKGITCNGTIGDWFTRSCYYYVVPGGSYCTTFPPQIESEGAWTGRSGNSVYNLSNVGTWQYMSLSNQLTGTSAPMYLYLFAKGANDATNVNYTIYLWHPQTEKKNHATLFVDGTREDCRVLEISNLVGTIKVNENLVSSITSISTISGTITNIINSTSNISATSNVVGIVKNNLTSSGSIAGTSLINSSISKLINVTSSIASTSIINTTILISQRLISPLSAITSNSAVCILQMNNSGDLGGSSIINATVNIFNNYVASIQVNSVMTGQAKITTNIIPQNINISSTITSNANSTLKPISNISTNTVISGNISNKLNTIGNINSNSIVNANILELIILNSNILCNSLLNNGIITMKESIFSNIIASNTINGQTSLLVNNRSDLVSNSNITGNAINNISGSLNADGNITFPQTFGFSLSFPLVFINNITKKIAVSATPIIATTSITSSISSPLNAIVNIATSISAVIKNSEQLKGSLVSTTNIANSSFTGLIPLSGHIHVDSIIDSTLLLNVKLNGNIKVTTLTTNTNINIKRSETFENNIAVKVIIPAITEDRLYSINIYETSIFNTEILHNENIVTNIEKECIFNYNQISNIQICNKNKTVIMTNDLIGQTQIGLITKNIILKLQTKHNIIFKNNLYYTNLKEE